MCCGCAGTHRRWKVIVGPSEGPARRSAATSRGRRASAAHALAGDSAAICARRRSQDRSSLRAQSLRAISRVRLRWRCWRQVTPAQRSSSSAGRHWLNVIRENLNFGPSRADHAKLTTLDAHEVAHAARGVRRGAGTGENAGGIRSSLARRASKSSDGEPRFLTIEVTTAISSIQTAPRRRGDDRSRQVGNTPTAADR
jgi:hypothetical protein